MWGRVPGTGCRHALREHAGREGLAFLEEVLAGVGIGPATRTGDEEGACHVRIADTETECGVSPIESPTTCALSMPKCRMTLAMSSTA